MFNKPSIAGDPARPTPGTGELFGHPRGLTYLIAAEGFWAFAYYGMVALLTLYMTRELFTPGHEEHVVGFAAYRATVESVFGPMSRLALASQTFGLVTGLNYATPLLGGVISDRWLGQRRAVILGLSLLTVGHLLLATEAGFLAALLLIIVGAGFVKSNIAGQIGRLYAPEDTRRTRGFGLFLMAVNVGGFVTPLVCGTLGEKVGYRYGLLAAAAGMALGLVTYLAGLRHMPADVVRRPGTQAHAAPALQRGDLKVLAALVALLVAELLNVGTYNQAFNIFPVWAKQAIQLNVAGFEVPVTWFSTLDGALTIAGIALAVRIWAFQAKRHREIGDVTKVVVGCALTAIGFSILGGAALAARAGKAPILAGVGFFLCVDFALAWVDVVVMSLFSRAAPPALNTTMMGVFYLSMAGGNFLVGGLGTLFDKMTPGAFWLTHAAISGSAIVYLVLLGPWLKTTLAPRSTEAPDDLERREAAAAAEGPGKGAALPLLGP
jgi:POT family proton-dependent oligopeptide transporter